MPLGVPAMWVWSSLTLSLLPSRCVQHVIVIACCTLGRHYLTVCIFNTFVRAHLRLLVNIKSQVERLPQRQRPRAERTDRVAISFSLHILDVVADQSMSSLLTACRSNYTTVAVERAVNLPSELRCVAKAAMAR
jgi:hypothetical protein